MTDSIKISPRPLSGSLDAIPSKSHVHRLLICAALGEGDVYIPCPVPSEDILATARCLGSLGAAIHINESGLRVGAIKSNLQNTALLDCGESGSTYRFLVPVAASLGIRATFHLEGRLPSRPMDELWSVLEGAGAIITGKGSPDVTISGRLKAGRFRIAGNISSQFISGLLLALPNLEDESEIVITGELQSAGYVDMTLDALREFGVTITKTPTGFIVPGRQRFIAPKKTVNPEGDWSNSAIWLSAGAVSGNGITMRGLRTDSSQGDRAIADILRRFGAKVTVDGDTVSVSPSRLKGIVLDARDIPDLVPSIALVAAAAEGGTEITNVGRLALKESDRRQSVCDTLNQLGGCAEYDDDTMTIRGVGILGGEVDSCGDHRIAMLAVAASAISRGDITLHRAGALAKSYPAFLEHFTLLGGEAKKI